MRTSILIFTVLVLLMATQATADVIHVPEDYDTIQEGIDAASPGDIVMVAAGEYFEEISLRAGVIVQGAGEGQSIINGGGNSGDVVRAIGNDITSATKFTGFTVTGAISGGGMPGGGGIFCNSGASPNIGNNRCEGNDFGIVTWNQSGAYIHNNVVVNNNYTAISLSSASEVINNTIATNNIGIYDSGGWGTTVMNNIVVSNTSIGIGATNSSVPMDIYYNDVWNNGTNYNNCYPDGGDISEDPQFEDEPIGDYRLAAGSPCIDAGNPDSAYDDPDGTRNDMGAYGGPDAPSTIPMISLTAPALNDLNVPLGTDVSAVFTMEMDPATLTSETVILQGVSSGIHEGTVAYDAGAQMVVADPDADFFPGELVTTILTGDIQASGGESLRSFGWQFTCEVGGGSGVYDVPASYPVGYDLSAVITADFDRDGILDLAATDDVSNEVAILLGLGDGTFTPNGTYSVGSGPSSLCAVDVDADGALDLVVANRDSDDVSFLLGTGTGLFAPGGTASVNAGPQSVRPGDFNADGIVDLVTANGTSGDVSVLLGLGGGSFAPAVPYTVGTSPQAVRVGDLDNDGACDLVVANYGSSTVSVRLGAGDGSFGGESTYSTGSTPASLDLGDLNGDGWLDAVVVNESSNTISRLLGDGSGGFGVRSSFGTGGAPTDVKIGDVNGDGYLDAVVSCVDADGIVVHRGRGDGSFATPPTVYPCGPDPLSLACGDLDGDGDLDLATGDGMTGDVYVILNKDALHVVATDPAQYGLGIPWSSDVSATFSSDVDPGTLTSSSVQLHAGQSGPHAGVLSYDAGTYTVTLDPHDDFIAGEIIIGILTANVQATTGVELGGFIWSFTARVGGTSDGVFGDVSYATAGAEPRGLFAADYDADGDVDIAVTSSNYPYPGAAVILLNNGDGTFASPSSYTLGAADPISIYGADFDGDGDIDLATMHNQPGTSHVVVLRNAGDGSFSIAGSYTPVFLGQDIWGGDVDADGDIDLIATDGWGNSNNVKILKNNGNGTFGSTQTYTAGTWAREVVVEDVDNDGDLDLGVASSGDSNLSVLINDGTGAFPTLMNYALGANVRSLIAGDFNGDGHVDVAGGGDQVAVILGNGDGTFGSVSTYATGGNVKALTRGDFDGDGDIDLGASLDSQQRAWVIFNAGDGTFSGQTDYAVGDYPWCIQSADFDADGHLDLACAVFNADQVELLFNTGASAVEEETPVASLLGGRQLAAFPSPFANAATILYHTEAVSGAGATVGIYDVNGRLVRQLTANVVETGVGRATWDGTDMRGRRVPGGTYFCRLSEGERTVTRRLVYVR
jgi:hypothetical protein